MTKVFSDHCGPKGDKGDTGPPGPAGISAIGVSITGSIANAILFADASGNLAQDAGFTIDLFSKQVVLQSANDGGAVQLQAINTSATEGSSAGFYAEAAIGGGNAFLDLFAGSKEWTLGVRGSDGAFVLDNNFDLSSPCVVVAPTTFEVTIASLAGAGTRNVVVDANGKLSAP